MGVSFSLANKNKEISSIDILVRFKGERYKRSSGESVNPAYWLGKGKNCSEKREYPHGKAVNARLKEIKKNCDAACDNFTKKNEIPDDVDFWKAVDILENKSKGVEIDEEEKKEEVLFVNFMQTFIDRYADEYSEDTIKQYKTAKKKILIYEEKHNVKLRFEDIDIDFYNTLKKDMNEKGYSKNYFASIVKCVKAVFNEAKDIDKLHDLETVNNKKFVVAWETADSIYLNDDELRKIHELQITEKLLRKYFPDLSKSNLQNKLESCIIVKNKFLTGCCTALRVGDFNKLNKVNIGKDFIKIATRKTEAPVIIPILPMLREIIDSGFDITTRISDQKINDQIKDICMMTGIDELVEITKSQGGKKKRMTFKKYEIVTTHTARRSGATNLYKAGIPAISIMKITGHKTEQAFMKYIKITAEENAEMLANHPYFKKQDCNQKDNKTYNL